MWVRFSLLPLFLLFCPFPGFSDSEFEVYSTRPNILEVGPHAHPELGHDWRKLRQATIEAACFFLEMYPDEELYFMARDAELFYDAAKLISEMEPARKPIVHLINVSREAVASSEVTSYLDSVGISEDRLRTGTRIRMVDTGMQGTLHDVILNRHVPVEYRPQVRSQFVSSNREDIPELRAVARIFSQGYWGNAFPEVKEVLEESPKWTKSAIGYQFIDGKWEPISKKGDIAQNAREKRETTQLREDLRAHLARPDVIKTVEGRRLFWRELHKLWREGKRDLLLAELTKIAHDRKQYPRGPEMVKDFIDASNKKIRSPHEIALLPSDVLLDPSEFRFASQSGGRRYSVMQTHRDWVYILENMRDQVPLLFKRGQFVQLEQMLRELNGDYEFGEALQRAMKITPADQQFLQLAKLFYELKPGKRFDLLRTIFMNHIRTEEVKRVLGNSFIDFMPVEDLGSLAAYLNFYSYEPDLMQSHRERIEARASKSGNQSAISRVREAFEDIDRKARMQELAKCVISD